jgi:3'(2'), 5'-bisphosphate nucleotidase
MTDASVLADLDNLTDLSVAAAIEAAGVILDVYARPIHVVSKSDGSPVTEADAAAEKIIISHLAATGIPLLGEESVAAGIIPQLGERYFVVDPLDGTKEFIKRNGEFTVNIGLVENPGDWGDFRRRCDRGMDRPGGRGGRNGKAAYQRWLAAASQDCREPLAWA